jgi:hypothetical protein
VAVDEKKSRERTWFLGRLGLNAKWSSDHTWQVTQAKTGDRHVQVASVFAVHRKGETTLYSIIVGPLCLTIGDALGKENE